ncbi:hypothetical protein E2C01_025813 [Portunus trituberculatus]|uniref:Uncharacterized protein n=1 Tax=Portunus trituberculatus TaxID=210409 RepID=A0A5B7EEB8_PORTR|nr:hypothetical protein [Portunus trituberculatus]
MLHLHSFSADAFSYSFCLLFGDFIQFQKLMWELK